MKCPICGKELELRNKQIGTNENGDPIFNEYAICRDCKKQWNLDKQRAKRAAKKAAEKPVPEEKAPAEKPVQKDKAPAENPAQRDKAPAEKPVQKDKARQENRLQTKKFRSENRPQAMRHPPKNRSKRKGLVRNLKRKLKSRFRKNARALMQKKSFLMSGRQENRSKKDPLKSAKHLKKSATATSLRKKSAINTGKLPAKVIPRCLKQENPIKNQGIRKRSLNRNQ